MRLSGSMSFMSWTIICSILAFFPLETTQLQWSYAESGKRCLTECSDYGENYLWCYTGWGTLGKQWDYCEKGSIAIQNTLPFSKGNKQCVSQCLNGWCFTSGAKAEWDYCSNDRAQVSLTTSGELCMTECKGRLLYAHHCFTSFWQEVGFECIPGDIWLKSTSSKNESLCTSLCGKFGSSDYWCVVGENRIRDYELCDWDDVERLNLGRNPSDSHELSPFMKEVIQGKLLAKRKAGPSHAKDIAQKLREELEAWKALMRMSGEEINVTNSDDAITNFIITSNHGVNIVHYLQARIYQRHVGRPIREFPKKPSDNRMEELGGRFGDEKGQILSSMIGGSVDMLNLVPQSHIFYMGRWKSAEYAIYKAALTAPSLDYIDWEIIIRYNEQHRPVRYVVCYRAINTHGRITDESAFEWHDY